MSEQISMFISTGIILVIALLVCLMILVFATAYVNRHTAKTTVECPISSCQHRKNDMCMFKDVRLKLLINGYDHEGMFCSGYEKRHVNAKEIIS